MGSSSSITWYAPPSYRPHQLGCALLQDPTAIAIDNEGDIFTSQNGDNYTGVIEFPNPRRGGSQSCSELPLKPETGYEAGLAIDPKTDDLIVLDDPDECAGGVEGRMTIYAKPYRRQTGVSHDLGANCAGTLRLDATSTIAFVGDSTVSGGRGYILQRTYPDGKALGTYSGGSPAGFTTIPNTLPNCAMKLVLSPTGTAARAKRRGSSSRSALGAAASTVAAGPMARSIKTSSAAGASAV